MANELHKTQRCVKRNIAPSANDGAGPDFVLLRMAQQALRVHSGKTPPRIHFIVEWAEKRQLSQADIVREVGADKYVSTVWGRGYILNAPDAIAV